MKWTYKFIDINKPLEEGRMPEDIVPLRTGERWHFLNRRPEIAAEPFWSTVNSGDAVRLPLHPYCTFDQEPAVALALAFQIGAQLMLDYLTIQVPVFTIQVPIYRIHLAIGVPVEELDNYIPLKGGKTKVDCFRFWLGIAIRTSP